MGADISAFLFSNGELSKSQLKKIYNCRVKGAKPLYDDLGGLLSSNLGEHYVYFFGLRKCYLYEVIKRVRLENVSVMEHSDESSEYVVLTRFNSEEKTGSGGYVDWYDLLDYLTGGLPHASEEVLRGYYSFFTSILGLDDTELDKLRVFAKSLFGGV